MFPSKYVYFSNVNVHVWNTDLLAHTLPTLVMNNLKAYRTIHHRHYLVHIRNQAQPIQVNIDIDHKVEKTWILILPLWHIASEDKPLFVVLNKLKKKFYLLKSLRYSDTKIYIYNINNLNIDTCSIFKHNWFLILLNQRFFQNKLRLTSKQF